MKQFLVRLEVRAAPFALMTNSRKTECGAAGSRFGLEVRAGPSAVLRNLSGMPETRRELVAAGLRGVLDLGEGRDDPVPLLRSRNRRRAGRDRLRCAVSGEEKFPPR